MENTKDEIREFLVLGEEEGDRLDVYLSSQLGEMSRSYIQKIIKDKKVKVNGKIEKAKYAVKEDDSVVIEIQAPKLLEDIPQDIPIDKVYEDEDLKILHRKLVGPIKEEFSQPESLDSLGTVWGKLYNRELLIKSDNKFIDLKEYIEDKDILEKQKLVEAINLIENINNDDLNLDEKWDKLKVYLELIKNQGREIGTQLLEIIVLMAK